MLLGRSNHSPARPLFRSDASAVLFSRALRTAVISSAEERDSSSVARVVARDLAAAADTGTSGLMRRKLHVSLDVAIRGAVENVHTHRKI